MSYGTPIKRDPTPEGPCPRAAIEVTVETHVGKQRHYAVVVEAFLDVGAALEELRELYDDPSDFAEEATMKVVWFCEEDEQIGSLPRYQRWHNTYHNLED